MKILKRLLGKKAENGQNSGPPIEEIVPGIPESPEDFLKRVTVIRNAGIPPRLLPDKIRYYVKKMPDWLIRDLHKRIRTRAYITDEPDELPPDITRHLVSFRLSLYNPDYLETRDPGLGKVFLILFNLAPELVKNRSLLAGEGDMELTNSTELDEIMTDLSIFNLSDSQLKYTVNRILEYNRNNVAYTDEEITFLNNSELLRTFLDQLTLELQEFVQQTSDWSQYLDPDAIGIPPLTMRMLNMDSQAFFPGRNDNATFLEQFCRSTSMSELETQVDTKLRALFRKDVQLIIGRIRAKLVTEHVNLARTIRRLVTWHFLLLHEQGELPAFKLLDSLLEKSMRFHQNYYPDLVRAVRPIVDSILETVGEDYTGLKQLPVQFSEDLVEGMVQHHRKKGQTPIKYEAFLEALKKRRAKREHRPLESDGPGIDYQPEELNFLKRNPDTEVAIIMMNEKLGQAENHEPMLDGHYFYRTRDEYLKVVLLETLNSMTSSQAPLKIVRSILLKSLDRSREQSYPIMKKLISRLKEEGFKWGLVGKLLTKQKRKHHLTSIIKQIIARDPKWEWFLETEDPELKLERFSNVTGLAFFTGQRSDGLFKVTAKYEAPDWIITHISPDSRDTTPKN